MDVREKLVELIRNAHKKCKAKKTCHECEQYGNGSDCVYLFMADDLIACGVTVQDNTEITDKLLKQLRNAPLTVLHEEPTIEVVQEWISVKDRLPEHGDVVMVWHTYMEHPFVCQWDERSDCWIDDKWTFGRNTITHWCRLPQPPKGE